MTIRPGDVVVDLWEDLDKPRLYLVKKVRGRRAWLQPVKLVPTGKEEEVVDDKYVRQLLVVARTGKAGP